MAVRKWAEEDPGRQSGENSSGVVFHLRRQEVKHLQVNIHIGGSLHPALLSVSVS